MFRAHGATIGAIYPFRLSVSRERFLGQLEQSSFFSTDFDERERIADLRRRVYDLDEKWVSSEAIFKFSTRVNCHKLRTGAEIENVSFDAYIWTYPGRFGTILYWLHLPEHVLGVSDILELGKLARGSVESIGGQLAKPASTQGNFIDVEIDEESFFFKDFLALSQMLRERLTGNKLGKSMQDRSQPAFPIISIWKVANCSSGEEIIQKYGREVSAFTELWREFEVPRQKESRVKEVLATDFHPFDYAVTCVSTGAVVELHSTQCSQIASSYGLEIKDYRFLERLYLALQCEIPILEHFALNFFDRRLSRLQTEPSSSKRLAWWNPFAILTPLGKVYRLRQEHSEIAKSVAGIRSYYFARKSYIHQAVGHLRSVFRISALEKSVERRLDTLGENTRLTLRMLATLFAQIALILSLMGLLLGMLRVIEALEAMKW